MYCSFLSLTNFRNYQQLDVELPNGPILVLGPNASGKTTLLEALYFLATTKSHRATTDRELVAWDARAELGVPPFARVSAKVQRRGTQNIEIIVMRENAQSDSGVARKRIRVNNLPKRAIDLIGQVNAVMFGPQDLDLIVGSPSLRRRYLDITISQIDPHYVRTLQTYQKVVLQRNSLLKSLAERGRRPPGEGEPDQLSYWDEELVQHGSYLLMRRLEVIAHLNRLADGLHSRLAGTGEALEVLYRSTVTDETVPAAVAPGEQAVRDQYRERLRVGRQEELRRAVTLAGPHRDDIQFTVGGVDMGIYGSRGQQRSVILAVKLAEVELMSEATGEMPLLLLDDVVSELDPERRRYLLEAVLERRQQVLVTATDLIPVGREFLSRASLFETTSPGILEARS
ncbi:MAG: DNA replication/repair protein RecF [Chloroflexota bacterium]|nr:DNA replication/repair protein RecF [Chloroflexota bacterium]